MKALVVYDSAYGNTQTVAEAIGEALGPAEGVAVRRVGEVKPGELAGLDILIVGSPTQKFTATGATTRFLKSIPEDALRGVKVAAFDTRFPQDKVDEVRILAFFVSIFGYAAKPIAKRLQKKGGRLVVPPEGFFVGDTEGPLLEGELERAAEWARTIARS
jgi:flavodoxin